ncbi:exodeoxyribonuclease V gamma subunit [Natronospira proteinivora]|uniref:RecBCD enzyme subunit RecC n=1 Tax=Natronospira proteinivora TaxID=1807133 RepID=A0ABT1GBI3_9GAMM|nr:exodeoxyribonuclease V gamma subunit [Natronospira proteinivora]
MTVDWLRQYPLGPLEDEVFLVQSNGMAQWLKLALAAPASAEQPGLGISAAHRFELPQSFLWRAYRSALGDDRVPQASPFEKTRLQWRLFRLLPELLEAEPETYLPLRRFLEKGDPLRKRHQLSRHLADLFDQYQVYRADWLGDWLAGEDQLRTLKGETKPLGEQRWQAALWRALHEDIGEPDNQASRAGIHQAFIDALDGEAQGVAGLPRRIVIFGITSLPRQVLEALHALSRHCQILMLVQNPCQHYWANIIEDRHLLKLEQTRHSSKAGSPGHPLLAAWGKQGRDYIGLLYDYDLPERYAEWFSAIDIFEPVVKDENALASAPLLQQIQQDIFDLNPLPQEKRTLGKDNSIRFHQAHSPQREVEILHDRLLAAFEAADRQGRPLRPRDIIVMVPDIEQYSPSIEAVFGSLDEKDPRYISYSIGDRRQRHGTPLAIALEHLMDLPNWRFTLGDVLDLLDVPAIQRRFGLREQDLPLLRQWIREAGIRWGLDAGQRQALDLAIDFEANSWRFGLKRMLLGYAVGRGEAWAGIEPYPEIGGLDAELLGRLRALLDALEQQWQILAEDGTPTQWAERVEGLLAGLFDLRSPEELQLEVRLMEAMAEWQTACSDAGFDETIPLGIAKEAWLEPLEDEGPAQRFLAGRVNFCTFMPMRSIPFRMVCLLGMNDGDYPRSRPPLDFDLMGQRGQYRPGDRSRREDDRYLFLEALLSAREHLHVSWVGRNIRDNESLPPSVLVSQLRDHIQHGWQLDTELQNERIKTPVDWLTVAHPLQGFSPAYNGEGEMFTYAGTLLEDGELPDEPSYAPLPAPELEDPEVLRISDLMRFLKDAPAHFFRERLKLRFDDESDALEEHEPFQVAGLEQYDLANHLLEPVRQATESDVATGIQESGQRLLRSGRLPVGEFGELNLEQESHQALAAAERWQARLSDWPEMAPALEIELDFNCDGQSVRLEDWISDLRQGTDTDKRGRLALKGGPISKDGKPRYNRLLEDWVIHLAVCAQGENLESWIIASDTEYCLAPVREKQALALLQALFKGWLAGLRQPLPLPVRTVFQWLGSRERERSESDDPIPEQLETEYEGNSRKTGEMDHGGNAALRRAFPDAASLLVDQVDEETAFAYWAKALYQPLVDALNNTDEGDES